MGGVVAFRRALVLQVGLVELGLGGVPGRGGLVLRTPQGGDGGLVDEVFPINAAIDLRQIADDGAAETDEEGGEDQGKEPLATVEPFFGQAERTSHRRD